MPDIISIGECMVEFSTGENLVDANKFERAWGGDTITALVAASRLGSATAYITKLGGDPFGTRLLESMQEEAVEVSQVRIGPGFTGLYFVALVEDDLPQIYYYRKDSAASTMAPAELSPEYLAKAQMLHVSGITQALSTSCRETILSAMQIAKEQSLKVSYDPNFRPRLTGVKKAQAAFEEAIPYSDIVLASWPEDTGQLLALSEPEQAIEYLWEKGVETVVIKLGPKGCLVGHSGQITSVAPHPVGYVVDPTGAGDVFDGAFLHCLLRKETPREAAHVASVMAALKLKGHGAIASMPDRREVEAALGHVVP